MSLNRQPGPMNPDALQMLREKDLRRGAEVVTSDGQLVGKALSLHHRPDEIDPDLKLYATFLETANPMLGLNFFVPVDFIAGYDPEAQRVSLTVDMSAVMNETWDREPAFIAGHLATEEVLVS